MKNVIDEVIKKLGDLLTDVQVQYVESIKNNDTVLNGITIVSNETGAGPIVYIDELLDKGKSADVIVDFVLHVYESNIDCNTHELLSIMKDYNLVKDLFALRLINKQLNTKLLSDIPHKEFLDLAVIVEISFPADKGYNASSKVGYNLLDLWNVTFEDVYSQATTNFNKEPSLIISMVGMFEEMGYDIGIPEEFVPMYIMTSQSKIKGASRILDEGALRNFADEHDSDIIVLPSSTHEVILLPVSELHEELELDGLTRMVQEVNDVEISPEEVLSNHAYFYGRDTGWN